MCLSRKLPSKRLKLKFSASKKPTPNWRGNIQTTQAGIAYLQTATAGQVQADEKYIQALTEQRKAIRQSLAVATSNLEKRRLEWTEAMKEQRIIEKLKERRLHQWEREADVANQKTQDDVSIGRYVRTRNQH